MAKDHTEQLHTAVTGFAASAIIVVLIAGVAAWWAQGREIVLPDGPVYRNGKVVGRAAGVTSSGTGHIHFAEITGADGLLQAREFQYGDSTLSVSTIHMIQYPDSGGGARLLRVIARNYRRQ